MAVEATLPVVNGGEETAGGGQSVCSKGFRKVKNVLNFIKCLKGGGGRGDRPVSPPGKGISSLGSASSDVAGESSENPIIAAMEKNELGKAVFMMAVPMTTGMIFLKSDALSPAVVHFTSVAEVVGCTAIFNGILLRKTCPRVASVVEQAGVSSVLLGFYMLVWNFLPPELRFVPVVCYGFSLLPSVMAAFHGGGGTDQQGV